MSEMTFEWRALLQNELLERCRRNPQYSLRAFARFLGVEPSALSKMLHGKRAISRAMVEKFCQSLKIPSDLALTEADSRFTPMARDTFELISHWYYYAILELTYLSDFDSTISSVVTKLGLSRQEACTAVNRLFKMGLLEKSASGKWVDTFESLSTLSPGLTTLGFPRYQTQLLEKAIDALTQVEPSRRDQSSMTMAIDASEFPRVQAEIKKFRRGLSKTLKAAPQKTQVYQLVISFYPLTTEPTEPLCND